MIDDFRGPYKWLSNFEPSPVTWGNLTYPTVEHAYQAAKTDSFVDRGRIQSASTPRKAREIGQTVEMSEDFEERKDHIMYMLLKQKFAIPELKEKLLATGDQMLIEGNSWGDVHWGVCNGLGLNTLGRLLMKIRKEIRYEKDYNFLPG